MPNETNLAPWSHPKAQRWFDTLLERSGFIQEIEDQTHLDDSQWDVSRARIVLSFLVMLGRPGIWPDRHRGVLNRAASKANRTLENPADRPVETGRRKKRPLTLEQHQKTNQAKSAIMKEIEIVRRRAGMSNRKMPIKQPPQWGKFW